MPSQEFWPSRAIGPQGPENPKGRPFRTPPPLAYVPASRWDFSENCFVSKRWHPSFKGFEGAFDPDQGHSQGAPGAKAPLRPVGPSGQWAPILPVGPSGERTTKRYPVVGTAKAYHGKGISSLKRSRLRKSIASDAATKLREPLGLRRLNLETVGP